MIRQYLTIYPTTKAAGKIWDLQMRKDFLRVETAKMG